MFLSVDGLCTEMLIGSTLSECGTVVTQWTTDGKAPLDGPNSISSHIFLLQIKVIYFRR